MATIVTFADRASSKAGKAALDGYATLLASESSGLVKALRPMLIAFPEEQAGDLFEAANKIAMAKRPGWTPAPIRPQRVSAAKGLWKAAEWKAWPAFLDTLETINPAWDDLIMACNWFRSPKTKLPKTSLVPPTIEATRKRLSELTDKRAVKRAAAKAKAEARDAMSDTDKVRLAPTATLVGAIERIGHLAEIEGKGKGAAFLNTALKALQDYQPLVVAREREAIKAKAAADALAKFDAEISTGK